MSIVVEDDYLDDDYFNSLIGEFTKSTTPYYLGDGVSYEKDGYIQFVHTIYGLGEVASNFFELLEPFFTKIKVSKMLFCKINFLQRTEKVIEHGWHIDVNDIAEDSKEYAKTNILYLNTNNGYTLFKNGIKVPSKANRSVIFPNYFEHSGSTNTCEAPYRLALVTNYFSI